MDLSRGSAFVIAVVPFNEVAIRARRIPEAGQFACAAGADERTAPYLGKGQPAQPVMEISGVALTAFGERQIRKSGVLTGQTPSCLAMSCQVNDPRFFMRVTHRYASLKLSNP